MTLEDALPRRVSLGAGSGEALNEVPLGLDWPSVGEQQARLEPALEAITRLWDGETVTMDGGWFRLKEAKLYTPRGAPPDALRLRLRADRPRDRRAVRRRAVDARRPRAGARDHRRLPGRPRATSAASPARSSCQSGFAWARTRSRPSRRAQVEADAAARGLHRRHPRPGRDAPPRRRADERRGVRPEGFIVGGDPAEHVERLREIGALGPTAVCLQLIGTPTRSARSASTATGAARAALLNQQRDAVEHALEAELELDVQVVVIVQCAGGDAPRAGGGTRPDRSESGASAGRSRP